MPKTNLTEDTALISRVFRSVKSPQAVIYQKRRPFIYQDQILKAQTCVKRKKLGMWGTSLDRYGV